MLACKDVEFSAVIVAEVRNVHSEIRDIQSEIGEAPRKQRFLVYLITNPSGLWRSAVGHSLQLNIEIL